MTAHAKAVKTKLERYGPSLRSFNPKGWTQKPTKSPEQLVDIAAWNNLGARKG